MYLLLALSTLLACGSAEPTAASTPPAAASAAAPAPAGRRVDMPVADFIHEHGQGVQLIDVRTPEEYASGHVPGAINIPLDQIDEHEPRLRAHPKGQPVYLICAVGGRSGLAADKLAAAGYHAVNVDGGTNGWAAANLPIVTN